MKAKNQQHFTSDADAKEKLIVYVYEYLIQSGAKQAADLFKDNIGYTKDIKVNDGPGFLQDWWCVFWDLYCAAPERRHNQPAPSNDAQAFHDLMRQTPMSPSIAQTSPPQQPLPPQFMGGPRYGPPPPGQRPPPRMQGPLQHVPPGPPGGFMPAASPRYAQHSGPPSQPHMNQAGPPMGFVHGPDPMGPSPGLNRMTPSGPPPQQVVGPPPPSGPPPQAQRVGSAGMPPQQQQPGGGNSGGGNWQGNFSVNSPADQQCFMPGPPVQSNQQGGNDFGGNMMMNEGPGMMYVKSAPPNNNQAPPQNQQQDEYVMPAAYGQPTDQSDAGSEILKLKESLESNTNDGEQTGFDMDFPESQGKWQH